MNLHRYLDSPVLMCRVVEVARAGFYEWLNKPWSDRATESLRLVGLIRDSYVANGGVFGSNRVFGDLREAGERCGRHRVARLMRANKIKAIRGYKAPRQFAGHPSINAPNRLNREFTVDAPKMAVWRHKPKSSVIVHSDQGSQYGSDDWRRFFLANDLEPGMSDAVIVGVP